MEASAVEVHDVTGGCLLRLRVKPGSKRDEVVGAHGGALKVSVTAPPERGRANDAVVGVVAILLGIPPSRITMTAGLASRNKSVVVLGMTADQVRGRLAAAGVQVRVSSEH